MLRYVCLSFAFSFATTTFAAEPASWPEFRGPTGQGHADVTGLPLTWSETENVKWKCELPGKGWSSPVIAGNEIWMTTAVEEKLPPEEEKKRLVAAAAGQPLNVAGHLSMRALCVDRTTGKLLYDVELMTADGPEPIHSLNSYASPTPILQAGRLYCHFGANGTAALDTKTRKVVWKNQALKIKHENGPGSTPVLFENLLIFHCDGSDQQYIVALNKESGEVVWKKNRSGELRADPQLKKAYGTPLIATVEGSPVLISPASDWLYAYNPRTGDELWKLNYGVLGFSIVPRPVVGHGMVYMCTSFMQSELLAVKLTEKAGSAPEIAWRYKKQVPTMPSPLLVGDEIYIISDKGIATCLDAATGEVHGAPLRVPGNYCASPLFADGRIYLMNQEGVTTVLAPGKEFKVLATNKLAGQIMASPAALEGALYIRTEKALYRIEKP